MIVRFLLGTNSAPRQEIKAVDCLFMIHCTQRSQQIRVCVFGCFFINSAFFLYQL